VLKRLAAQRDVGVLVDDDVTVCQAARAAGFTVYQADWSRPDVTLHRAQGRDGRT
jgi:thiamine monophosphate synthase